MSKDTNGDVGGRPPAATTDTILDALRGRDRLVLSTKEVGELIDASHRTALKYLKELEEEGAVERRKVGGSPVWYIPGERPVVVDDPSAVEDVLATLESTGALESTDVDGTTAWHLPGEEVPDHNQRRAEVVEVVKEVAADDGGSKIPESGGQGVEGRRDVEDEPEAMTAGGGETELRRQVADTVRDVVGDEMEELADTAARRAIQKIERERVREESDETIDTWGERINRKADSLYDYSKSLALVLVLTGFGWGYARYVRLDALSASVPFINETVDAAIALLLLFMIGLTLAFFAVSGILVLFAGSGAADRLEEKWRDVRSG